MREHSLREEDDAANIWFVNSAVVVECDVREVAGDLNCGVIDEDVDLWSKGVQCSLDDGLGSIKIAHVGAHGDYGGGVGERFDLLDERDGDGL